MSINAITAGRWTIDQEGERLSRRRVMTEVAEKVVAALSTLKNPLQAAQLVQYFVDFAEKGIRQPKEEVDKTVTEFLYTDLSDVVQEQYLHLSGYMWKAGKRGLEIVKLRTGKELMEQYT